MFLDRSLEDEMVAAE